MSRATKIADESDEPAPAASGEGAWEDGAHASALVPQRPGDAPFRNLLAIRENEPGFLVEAKREIRSAALRQLEALDRVYRELVEQAQAIVAAARRDLLLHDLPMNATKIRGRVYHLYERTDRDRPRFFAILPPEDYRSCDPRATYLASYRLNEDSSWSRLDEGAGEPWVQQPS